MRYLHYAVAVVVIALISAKSPLERLRQKAGPEIDDPLIPTNSFVEEPTEAGEHPQTTEISDTTQADTARPTSGSSSVSAAPETQANTVRPTQGGLLVPVIPTVPTKRHRSCRSIPSPGECQAAFPRYYYNASTSQCDCYIFGGCDEEEGSYETLADCREKCLPDNPTEGPTCKYVFIPTFNLFTDSPTTSLPSTTTPQIQHQTTTTTASPQQNTTTPIFNLSDLQRVASLPPHQGTHTDHNTQFSPSSPAHPGTPTGHNTQFSPSSPAHPGTPTSHNPQFSPSSPAHPGTPSSHNPQFSPSFPSHQGSHAANNNRISPSLPSHQGTHTQHNPQFSPSLPPRLEPITPHNPQSSPNLKPGMQPSAQQPPNNPQLHQHVPSHRPSTHTSVLGQQSHPGNNHRQSHHHGQNNPRVSPHYLFYVVDRYGTPLGYIPQQFLRQGTVNPYRR